MKTKTKKPKIDLPDRPLLDRVVDLLKYAFHMGIINSEELDVLWDVAEKWDKRIKKHRQ